MKNEIRANRAIYIKLGVGGEWDDYCLKEKQVLRIGYREIDHDACLSRKKWETKILEQCRDIVKGRNLIAAKNHVTQLRSFYEAPAQNTVWITFSGNCLWWCMASDEIELLDDKCKIRRTSRSWNNADINGNLLTFDTLNGRLLEVGFRWFDEGSFTDDDRFRKNNWQPIIDALTCPTDKNRLKKVDFQNPDKLTINELLSAHGSVLDELKHRGVIRSKNNPTGDYAEWLFSTKLGLTLEPQANGGFDATDPQGMRYQIKSRRVTPDNPSTQLGVIRNLDQNDFDFLLAVVFDADWQILRAAKISHKVVGTLATFRSYQNGHIMHLRPTVFDAPEVEDITDVLRD